jgi:hypothetical protein
MNRFLIIVGFAVLFSINSCKKDNTVKDYRSVFIGTYVVKETTTCYGAMGDCFYEKDTTIHVTAGEGDSTISVLGRTLNIYPDGNYSAYHYGLQFRNDSIFSFFMNGGLGAGTYIRHEGLRISKKVN